MKQLCLRKHISIGMGLVLLVGGSGCVTASDLEQLDQGLTRKVDGLTATFGSEVRGLRAELTTHVKRQQELTNALDSVKSTIETDIDTIHHQLGTFQLDTRAALEEVKTGDNARLQVIKDLKAEAAKTKKALDDYAAKTRQDIETIEAFTGNMTKQIQDIRQGLSTFSANIEHLPPLVTSLGTELRTLTRTLLNNYRLEEATLRDRLKTLEQLTKQLEPVAVSQQTGALPANK